MPKGAVSRLVPATHRRVGRVIRHDTDWRAIAKRLALENADLRVQRGAQVDELRQSQGRLVEAADNERRRLERDLHDGAQQRLVTLLLSLQLAKAEVLHRSDPTTSHLLDQSIRSLRQALDELRNLARGIHPTILREAGATPASRRMVGWMPRARSRSSSSACRFCERRVWRPPSALSL